MDSRYDCFGVEWWERIRGMDNREEREEIETAMSRDLMIEG